MFGRGKREPVAKSSLDLRRATQDVDDFELLIARTPWRRYRRLDREHRDRSLTAPPTFSQWFRVQPADVAVLAGHTGKPVAAAGLLSMHPDGYIRQAAVEVLGESGDAQALPFLLLRCTDWVEQVELPARSGALLENGG